MKRISVLNVDVISQKDLESRLHTIVNALHFNMYKIDCTQGACKGRACPVNFGDEDTEYSQNMGCLPTPFDLVRLRAVHGYTWACHDDYSKPCVSAVKLNQALGLPFKIHQLLDETESWDGLS